jgi:predicted nuclease of predicted toxin-antitoxin system
LSILRLLANMNISPDTVAVLRQHGWDIIRVPQVLPMNASDQEILDLARGDDRTVITQDLDFSALLALGKFNRPSLISIRMSVSDPETISRNLLKVLPEMEKVLQEGCAITIEDAAVRVRKLPIG